MFLCCKGDLGSMCKVPPRNNSKYLVSMDNWFSIIWYIYIKHLYIGYCFLPYLSPKMYLFNSHCLLWLLWFHLILLNMLSVIFNVDRDDDPICVHFVFKCKTVNNALILGELSYIHYNTLFVLISIGIGCCWKTNIFFGTLCAIIKCMEGLFVFWNLALFGVGYLIPCYLFSYS
jgi:hypothetical protein